MLFFDFSGMPPPEQIRAQQAALEFIDERMTASDLVAVLTYASGLRVEQGFTDDGAALREIILKFRIGKTEEIAVEDTTEEADPQAEPAFVPDETEFNVFNTDRKLAALESAARMLGSLPERKVLVYFSNGAGKTGSENESQLRATVNAAVRASVAFYPIDAVGWRPCRPERMPATACRGTGIFSGQTQRKQGDKLNDEQETVTALASGSGGKAFLDSNDLALGIVQAQGDVRSYYVLGYYSTNPAMDGRYRRIEVKIQSQQQALLEYRRGHYGSKEWGSFSSSDKERQLQRHWLWARR